MFSNKERERKEVKQTQSRVEYFRSHDQKSHQKENKKICQLVGKYNSAYKKVSQETNQTKNWENFSNLPCLIFSFVLGGGEFSFFLVPYFKKEEGIVFVFRN